MSLQPWYFTAGAAPSQGEYFLGWAAGSHELSDTPSKAFEIYQDQIDANRRHTGVKVDTMTLQGSTQTQAIKLILDLVGRRELGQGDEGYTLSLPAQALPDDRNKEVEFLFSGATFKMYTTAGANETTVGMENFAWEIQNNQEVRMQNSTVASLIMANKRKQRLQINPIKAGDYFSALRRVSTFNEFKGVLTLRGLNDGTGINPLLSYTVITITWPRLSFADSDDQTALDRIVEENITLTPLKPDTSSNDVTITYSEI